MAEIIVNKEELKDVRDSIDKLLKVGRETVKRVTEYGSDESKELSDRQKKILKYIENNPGTIKERVLEKPKFGSRMTIDKSIDGLIGDGMIIVRRDDSNQHIQHLYFNNEHIVLSLFNDFEFFKQVYFRLIDETRKELKKLEKKVNFLNNETVGYYMEMWNLLATLLMPYKHLIMMYIMSDLLLRQEQRTDKNILHYRFAIVYGNMKEIHAKLHEDITPIITNLVDRKTPNTAIDRDLNTEPLNSSLYDVQTGLSSERIDSFISYCEQYGLSGFAEPVLDFLWKISYPVLSKVDISHAYEDREFLKDWRNIISRDENIKYKPKTTQAQNLGKNNISS
jgi:hypothetical protein